MLKEISADLFYVNLWIDLCIIKSVKVIWEDTDGRSSSESISSWIYHVRRWLSWNMFGLKRG